MFFDYPAEEEIYNKIKQKVCANTYHYMNYQNFKNNEENILKTFFGMTKYACNNLNGKVELERAAAALGLTAESIEIMLSIFEDCKIIKIQTYEENFYIVSLNKEFELSEIKNSTKYKDLIEIISNINNYKNQFMYTDIL